MAIVKANYTRKGRVQRHQSAISKTALAETAQGYVRTLFKADGKVERGEVYTMIDQAANGSYFFRLVISPDPQREDSDKNLSLRELTEKTIQSLEDRFQRPCNG